MTSIQVSVRVRPFNGREKKYNSKLIVHMKGPVTEISQVKQGKVLDSDPRKFTFDHCFWTHDPGNQETFDGQEKVYNTIGKSILDNSMQGFNSCLFAYGQTGSGKTYTMMGIPSDPGVIPRLARDLFERAAALKETHAVAVDCSYLEIYNEQIRDLLNPAQGDKPLKARQHPKLGVFVENLTKLSASSTEEIEKFIDDGALVRSVAATNMNAQSSRSHAILTLNIRVKTKDGEVASQLHLVDLAGSERAGSTGAEGDTLKEGSNINKSLTTLGMCLSRLAEIASSGQKHGHIPFRDSQLTWLLNQSLGGNSKTAMLANISPADINFEETIGTLRFASTTKKIKNNATVNEDPQQKLIKDLRAEIAKIREQIDAFDAGNPNAMSMGSPGAGGEDEDDGYGEDDDTGVGEGESPADKLTNKLSMNINLMMKVGATEEEKAEVDRAAKASREDAMKKLNSKGKGGGKKGKQQSSVDNTQPRMITLNEDLHALPTVALLYYLPNGDNWVGTDAPSATSTTASPLPANSLFAESSEMSSSTTMAPLLLMMETTLVHLPATCCSSKEKLFGRHFALRCNLEQRTVSLVVPKVYSSTAIVAGLDATTGSNIDERATPTPPPSSTQGDETEAATTEEAAAAVSDATLAQDADGNPLSSDAADEQKKEEDGEGGANAGEAEDSGDKATTEEDEGSKRTRGDSVYRDPMSLVGGSASSFSGTYTGKPAALVFVNGKPINLESATGEGIDEEDEKKETPDAGSQSADADPTFVAVTLQHMDRIVVGSVAFRYSRPSEWANIEREIEKQRLEQERQEAAAAAGGGDGEGNTNTKEGSEEDTHLEEEFSRRTETLTHLQHLQDHDRLTVERQAAQGLHDLIAAHLDDPELMQLLQSSEESKNVDVVAVKELVSDWINATNYSVGESETRMVQHYPKSADEDDYFQVQQDRHLGLQYDYSYAITEKNNYFKEKEREAREKELNLIQEETDAKEAEIDALKHQLETEQQEQKELAEKHREEEEAKAKEAEAKAAEKLAEEKAAEEEAEQARQQKRLSMAAASTANTSSGNLKGPASAGGNKAASPTLSGPAQSAQKKMNLMKELQQYEENCRLAKEWKPAGPADPTDAAEYRIAIQGPTLDSVRNKDDLKFEVTCSKYRVKKGFFGNSNGHIPVLLVVRSRFLYWYEEDHSKKGQPPQVQAHKPEGVCYIWGCDMQPVSVKDAAACGKKYCLRIVPCVPKGGGAGAKGAKASGDENAVVFSFNSQPEYEGFVALVKALSEPECPPDVAELIKSQEADA